MTNRKKTALFMFVDYLICLLLQLIGLIIFSWMLNFSWGYFVYSVLSSLVLFGLIYSRAHGAAQKDIRHKELKSPLTEGLLLVAPLVIFNLLIIGVYALLAANIIPASFVLIKILYSFPENQPRVATEVFLLDYITPFVRIWFGTLVGFLGDKTSPLCLLISPAITLLAAFCGYFAGSRKFFISNTIVKVQKKIKNKFNE